MAVQDRVTRLGIGDLMRESGLSRDTCYKLVKEGKLPGSIAGRRLILTHDAFGLWKKLSYWPPRKEDLA